MLLWSRRAGNTGILTISDKSGAFRAGDGSGYSERRACRVLTLSPVHPVSRVSGGSGSIANDNPDGLSLVGVLRLMVADNISAGATGPGPGTIGYTYDSNTGPSRRGSSFARWSDLHADPSFRSGTPEFNPSLQTPLDRLWRDLQPRLVDQRRHLGDHGSRNRIGQRDFGHPLGRPQRHDHVHAHGSKRCGTTDGLCNSDRKQSAAQRAKIITASPNPVLTTDSTSATTKISWSAPSQVKNVEIHENAPNGPTVGAGGASGSFQTAPGIADPTIYFLQDVTGGKPLTVSNTLDTVAVRVADPGNTVFDSSPLYLPPNKNTGTLLLTWNAPAATKVQISVGSPRKQIGGTLSPSGSTFTGSWVSVAMPFFLQDASAGDAGSDAHTLAQLQASFDPLPAPMTSPVTNNIQFVASPNPILLAAGQTTGTTTLSWNAPGHPKVVVFVNAPDTMNGTQMTGISGSKGSAKTGSWAKNGMKFYLQDASGSSYQGPANTIATLTVSADASASASIAKAR